MFSIQNKLQDVSSEINLHLLLDMIYNGVNIAGVYEAVAIDYTYNCRVQGLNCRDIIQSR